MYGFLLPFSGVEGESLHSLTSSVASGIAVLETLPSDHGTGSKCFLIVPRMISFIHIKFLGLELSVSSSLYSRTQERLGMWCYECTACLLLKTLSLALNLHDLPFF